MNSEEQEFFDSRKDRCRLSFEERGKMALIQESMFLEKKLNSETICVDDVISNWLTQQQEFFKVFKPVEYDLNIIRLKDKIVVNNYLKDKEKEINKFEVDLITYQYLFVVQRKDGMVVTVGKTTKTEKNMGDLFSLLNTNGLSGTENTILRTEFGNEIFKEYDRKLKNYLDKAWVIPIKSGIAKKLERQLGDELIEKGVPILNYYSHRQ